TVAGEIATQHERARGASGNADGLTRDAVAREGEARTLASRLLPRWAALTEDEAPYRAHQEDVESCRPDAARFPELEKAHGQVQLLDEQLQRLDAELDAIALAHRICFTEAGDA